MHWLVVPKEAKATKLNLEAAGLQPRLERVGNNIHICVPEYQGDLIWGATQEPCEICIATRAPHTDPTKRYRYAVYPPLVLFSSPVELQQAKKIMLDHQCTHAALNRPIPNLDIVRRPQIEPIFGDFGSFDPNSLDFDNAFWCTCRQNGIYQTWAPLYTMFSRGNITEKKRVLEFSGIKGSTVIDLYCGIGYFTFSYAKNDPKVVYGWELNPWSIEGLRRAALVNKWNCRIITPSEPYIARQTDKLVIFAEDNSRAKERIPQLMLDNVSHINMGLLPDCRLAWDTAKLLAGGSSKTVFHVHENVHENDMDQWQADTSAAMGTLVHLEKIKQFSPGVWHVCGDFVGGTGEI